MNTKAEVICNIHLLTLDYTIRSRLYKQSFIRLNFNLWINSILATEIVGGSHERFPSFVFRASSATVQEQKKYHIFPEVFSTIRAVHVFATLYSRPVLKGQIVMDKRTLKI
jgi:hypothetical protein